MSKQLRIVSSFIILMLVVSCCMAFFVIPVNSVEKFGYVNNTNTSTEAATVAERASIISGKIPKAKNLETICDKDKSNLEQFFTEGSFSLDGNTLTVSLNWGQIWNAHGYGSDNKVDECYLDITGSGISGLTNNKINVLNGTRSGTYTFKIDWKYNQKYSINIKVHGSHYFIFHTGHNFTYSNGFEFTVSKGTPSLSFTNVNSDLHAKNNVTVTTNDKDVTINDKTIDGTRTIYNNSIISSEGKHEITIENNRDLSNLSRSYTIYIDKTKPVLSSEIKNGATTNVAATVTVTDTYFKKLYFKKPAAQTYQSTSKMSYTIDGTNGEWEFYAEDMAGNESSVYKITYDNVNPTINVIREDNGAIIDNDSYVNSNVTLGFSDNIEVKYFELYKYASDRWKLIVMPDGNTLANEGYYKVVVTDTASNVTERLFTIDKTKPILTSDIAHNGITNGIFTVKADDINFLNLYYREPDKIFVKARGREHTILALNGVWNFYAVDRAGNVSETYTVTFDNVNPTIELTNSDSGALIINGGIVNSDILISYSDLYGIKSSSLQMYSGRWVSVSIPENNRITNDGYYKFTVTDNAENKTEITYYINKTRAYITNITELKTLFMFGNEIGALLDFGQIGNSTVIDLGYTAQAFSISVGNRAGDTEYLDGLAVTGTFREYSYDNGVRNILNAVNWNKKSYDKLGAYEIVITNAVGLKLTIAFEIDIKSIPNWDNDSFRYIENNEYLVYRNSSIAVLSEEDFNKGIRLHINGISHGKRTLSYSDYMSLLNEQKHAVIEIIPNGIEAAIISASIYVDEDAPDVHNVEELLNKFVEPSGSYLGISMQDIEIKFGAGKYEFPETATLKYIATAYNEYGEIGSAEERNVRYESNKIINFSGYFELTITDDNGNASTWSFTILEEWMSAGERSLKHEYFTAPSNYSVKLPIALGTFNITGKYDGKYTADKRYLFASIENAMEFAYAAEFAVCVIKQDNRWLYRPGNQGIQIAYTSESALSQKIMSTVDGYVKYTDEFKLGGKPYILCGTDIIMDAELLYNGNYINIDAVTINGIEYKNILLVNKEFVFTYNNTRRHKSSITLTYLNTNTVYVFQNGRTIGEITGGSDGLYRVDERLAEGIELSYYVYIDNVAPTADVGSLKAGAEDVEIRETIAKGEEIVFQVKEFSLLAVNDIIDNYSLARFSGKGIDAVFSSAYPVLNYEHGYSGEYTVAIYDRSGNNFSFKIYIMSSPPTASLNSYGSGDSEYCVISITLPKNCVMMALSITHNGNIVSVDSDGTAVEETVNNYVFRKGGRYALNIVDNYNRTTLIELKYTKDMPDISLSGVKPNGITNRNVVISVPQAAEYSVQFDNGTNVVTQESVASGIRAITVLARDDNNGRIIFKAWFNADPEAYNDTSFEIDTIPPEITIVNGNGSAMGTIVNEPVYIEYDKTEIKEIYLRLDGKYKSYTYGQALTIDGVYEAVGTDFAGNETIKQWVSDCQVKYTVNYDNKFVSKAEIINNKQVIVTRSFSLIQEETAVITAALDGYSYDLDWNSVVTANGLYVITITDSIGNIDVLAVRVISAIENVTLTDGANNLLSYGATTNQGIKLTWEDESYIKDVQLKVGNSITRYDYAKGELIEKEGSGYALFADVVGNTLKVPFTIDKTVDVEFKYNSVKKLPGENTYLTLSFSIIMHEAVNIAMRKDGEPYSYVGETITANGVYDIVVEDNYGNSITQQVIVIGEREPEIVIKDLNGNIVSQLLINQPFVVSWEYSQYIEYVNVNGMLIESGAMFSEDGKYTIEARDLLGRTIRRTIVIKTNVDYTVSYNGSYILNENGRDVVLTRSFRAYTADNSALKALFNGNAIEIAWGQYVNADGDYELIIEDEIGNIKTLYIKVQNFVVPPEITDSEGNRLINGAVVRSGFNIVVNDLTASVTVNSSEFTGDTIRSEGRNRIYITDVIGNRLTINITIDNTVTYSIRYRKEYLKNNTTTLTNGFNISSAEDGLKIEMFRNDMPVAYVPGSWIEESGYYYAVLTDLVGNKEELRIEVDNRKPEIMLSDTEGEQLNGTLFNKPVILEWHDSLNIAMVTANDVSVASGHVIGGEGNYVIVVKKLLGETATINIKISYTVRFDALYSGQFDYVDDNGNVVTLTKSLRISGDNLSFNATRNGEAFVYTSNTLLKTEGIYVIEIFDTISNSFTLRVNVSPEAISGNVIIDGEEDKQGVLMTNRNFSISSNRFINETIVNGEVYNNAEIADEGKYVIDFLDVLGRKSTKYVTIDKTVEYDVFYKFINADGVYIANKFMLTEKEELSIRLMRDGIDIEYGTYSDNGLYTATLTDRVNNSLVIEVLVDNTVPAITISAELTNSEITVIVSDTLNVTVTVYLNGTKLDINARFFTLTDEGKYVIEAVDELNNESVQKAEIDKSVNITMNFAPGQTINFKPNFTVGEEITYLLYCGDVVVGDYVLNAILGDTGEYKLTATDKLGNVLVVKWEYLGTSRKFGAMEYKVPLAYELKIYFDGEELENVRPDENGYITLNRHGRYSLMFTKGKDEYQMSFDIDAEPPKIELSGRFKDNNRATGEVKISCNENYVVYFNGKAIDSPSTVKKVGMYKIVATDEVGNVKEYSFELYYSPNAVTWIIILISLFGLFIAIIMLLKRLNITKRVSKLVRRRK